MKTTTSHLQSIASSLRKRGMSLSSASLLTCIADAEKDRFSVAQAARRTQLKQPQVEALARKLERLQLLSITRDQDKREKWLSVTVKGKTAVKQLEACLGGEGLDKKEEGE